MLQLSRGQQLIILVFIGAILFGVGFKYAQVKSREAVQLKPVLQKEESFLKENQVKKMRQLMIHVAGAVENPGVYKLSAGSRVIDAVNQAKATQEADLQAINLAAPLADGQKVIVPLKFSQDSGLNAGNGQRGSLFAPAGAGFATPVSQLVNINTAGEQELDSLPGIGPSLAKRIIQYRETKGFFSTTEDIKKFLALEIKNLTG